MNKAVQKAFLIAGLACVILIALALVSNTVDDRQHFRDEAVKAIESSYAGPQTLIGPVLVRPYTQTTVHEEQDQKGVKRRVPHKEELVATSFPHRMDLAGTLQPNHLRHGLYNVEVYELQGIIKGHIDVVDPATEGTIVWGDPYLALSVSDVRGIVGTPVVTVNGVQEPMLQGAPASNTWQPNLRVPLRGLTAIHGGLDYTFDLKLAGTETLNVAPVADINHLELRSSWRSPLFAGAFLPHARDLDRNGFQAVWEISSLASATQLQLSKSDKLPDLISVSLTTLLDPYTLSDRAIKYGVLYVVLTFGGFFVFELLKRLPIHPIQYLLVGFGLAIFFLLLVSFSERMPFGIAYLLASGACIGLLTFYLSYVLRSAARGLGFGGLLTSLYAAVYGLLISEDNALILGSLLLFALLAAVMVLTRKVDWYRSTAPVPPPPAFPA